MKKILSTLLIVLTALSIQAQSVLSTERDAVQFKSATQELNQTYKATTAACGTPFISTGYPAWTNYWAGYMINVINNSGCPLVVHGFEARFQGTSGYRIYTKPGTFVGFELNSTAWTLSGTVASLTGISTVAPTPIPIAVNCTIPIGGIQGFYLTRTDNIIANRHLYIPGTGTAGTTIYASNADLSITEGSYIDPYFAFLNAGVRRPSLDICYSLACVLPLNTISVSGHNDDHLNHITWSIDNETSSGHFIIEKSLDSKSWSKIDSLQAVPSLYYSSIDRDLDSNNNYYRVVYVSESGSQVQSDIINISSDKFKTVVKRFTIFGTELTANDYKHYSGIIVEVYSDGSVKKILKN